MVAESIDRNSVLIESCTKLQEQALNYSGEDVLGGWTGKIKPGSGASEKPLPTEQMQGVADEEWDD